jgi:hypothetical protein
MSYRHSRAFTRSTLFDFYAKTLPFPKRKAVALALDTLKQDEPKLWQALRDAHVHKLAEADWDREAEAVDALSPLFETVGLIRGEKVAA